MRALLALLLLVGLHVTLAAATAKDLVGNWGIDVEGTWAGLQALPEMKSLPPEAATIAKSAFVSQAAGMTWTFTENRVTSMVNGAKQEETYVVISAEGDTIVTESTSAEGKKERSTVRLINGGMELTPASNPLAKVVLKRK
ncbi:MAG TPA: hypothetical protein VHX44_03875 [Planctomycetota bacterium]|jgi:hypothetical protein|nr:hypothetical protein [Planctomycetota bacterium]